MSHLSLFAHRFARQGTEGREEFRPRRSSGENSYRPSDVSDLSRPQLTPVVSQTLRNANFACHDLEGQVTGKRSLQEWFRNFQIKRAYNIVQVSTERFVAIGLDCLVRELSSNNQEENDTLHWRGLSMCSEVVSAHILLRVAQKCDAVF